MISRISIGRRRNGERAAGLEGLGVGLVGQTDVGGVKG